MNPEKHLLHTVPWQFFGSLTFKTLDVAEAVWVKMWFALMRKQADNFGVHFFDLMWVLRKEKGEATGRPHFHALIAGLPTSAVTEATCFSFMRIWEEFRGGNARVRVYDSTLTGVEYVLIPQGEELRDSAFKPNPEGENEASAVHPKGVFGGLS
jgi:hypothetical protein